MRIIRYHNTPVFNPAANFPGLRDEMDRLFEAAFPALGSLGRGEIARRAADDFPIDLYQAKDAFVLRAELPGFRKEDLNVEVANDVLTVTGHHKVENTGRDQKDGEAGQPSQEQTVSRSISLPEQVKVDGIQAKYENGVLTVTLPKQEEAKPRQIAIDVK